MTHRRTLIWLLLAALLWPMAAAAGDIDLSAADDLYAKGDLDALRAAAERFENAAATAPDDYEVNWKTARALRDIGDRSKKQMVEGWKKTCAEYGKKAMGFALKATRIEPERPEGHYYYGLSVGTYADGVSIFTALKEGLKDKTQKSFEKAYAIDRMYNKAGPILSLARFWAVLPWPMKDKSKALEYHREYQQAGYLDTNTEAQVYLAELLLDIGGKENRTRAESLLQKAAASPDPYWRHRAAELLDR